MKQVLLVLFAFSMVFCNSDRAARQQMDGATSTALNNAPSADAAESTDGVANEMTMYFPYLTAKTGDQVCVDVQVRGFEKILSMQYTLAWNKAILQFKELKNFKLPYLDAGDFGQHITKDGLLTSAWLDDALKGVSLPDGTSIYQICFEVIGKSGDNSFIKVADLPTPTEVANLREQLIPMNKENGSVKVE